MADWGPVLVAVVLFVVFTPGLLFQIPGKNHLVEFGSLNTNGKSIAIHTLLFFGVGGIIELAPGYFRAVYSSIKKAGGLCIAADKVQSRFAHTGSHFWGFETQGIVPDIVTMAK
ncbi:unnamed protein product [Camellia sinensis]